MPKPKSFLKDTKSKKKKKAAAPETADEYLAEGVDLEEAGEKWRAGDAAKSMRFFMRAIEMYDAGLTRFPNSFDLAYNKARIQYEITQHPKLLSQLPAPPIEILRIALDSHREALNKDQDNADILFNTAQVLTSLSEALTEGKRSAELRAEEALKYLQEALELFQRCLVLQELRFTEYQEEMQVMQQQVGNIEQQQGSSMMDIDIQQQPQQIQSQTPTESEEWAVVLEPVTKNTLIDTAIAQLDTLTTLCGLLTYDPGSSLAWVEEYSSDLLREKIAAYVEGTDRVREVAIAKAKFLSGLLEVTYRNGSIDFNTYKNELDSAFNTAAEMINDDPAGLCSHAEALVNFNSAITDVFNPQNSADLARSLDVRWQALTLALSRLSAASKLAGTENIPKIHIARGDAEMHRWRLGIGPIEYKPAKENAPTLLKNAETYYRGAAGVAKRDGWAEEEREGSAKEAFAIGLRGDMSVLEMIAVTSKEYLMRVADEMVDDGLVAPDDMLTIKSKMDPEEIVF
ncbi:hypothetical protein FQN57_007011 [Myotisia sp. PD_48]|nr:hypothetical protein FQN57_007011 [Myotisia sp. PD_48]